MQYIKSTVLLIILLIPLTLPAQEKMDGMGSMDGMGGMNGSSGMSGMDSMGDANSMEGMDRKKAEAEAADTEAEQADNKDEGKEYYDGGALHFEYSYLEGQLHGTTKEYYETSEQKAEIVYDRGKQVSARHFLRNGKLEKEVKYVGGKKNETQMEYYNTGELFRERKFINGKLEGIEKEYYQNGKLKAERNYVAGKKEGSAKGYHKNGNLQGDWMFENGAPISATIYYRTGELWLEHTAFDASGRLNGISLEYDKKGSLIAERYYVDDQLVKRKRKLDWFIFF